VVKIWYNYFKLRDLAVALKNSDKEFQITWDAANYFQIPEKETNEVLGAFAAHTKEVTTGYCATK